MASSFNSSKITAGIIISNIDLKFRHREKTFCILKEADFIMLNNNNSHHLRRGAMCQILDHMLFT